MSFIQNLFLSRDNNANGANYVGQQDRIWWNPDTNAFYYSDGNTAGGIIITGAGGNGAPGGPINSIQINDGNGAFTGTNNLTFNGTVVSITGNVEATYFVGDGSQLTNLPVQTGTYSNSNVQYYLPTYSGNLSPQYLLTDNYLYANGNSIFANTILSGNINLGNLYIDDQTIGGKNINGNITLLPEGDGWVVTPKILIDGMSVANTGGTLEFITPANVDIQFSPGTSGSILTSSNVVPTANNIASLGNITNRYTDLWIGTGNINLIDRTFNQNEQIYADSGNLIFANSDGIQFGDFELYGDTISTINPNSNIIIGKITSNAYIEMNRPLTINSTGGNTIAFQVERSGQTVVYAPTAIANTQAAMKIVGTSSGNSQPRNFNGTMLQVTGQDDQPTRVSFDAFGANGAQNSYVSIAARAARGNVDVPQSLQANDLMMRITNQGWTGNGIYAPSIARFNFAAAENFTSNAAVGTYANIQLTPIGSNIIKTIVGFSANGVGFPNASVGGTGNLGITFQDGSFQNTAYSATNTVGSVTAATGISIAPTNTSATGNITVTNTGVITVAGTSNQVFVNGANVIAPANGAITLSLPQDIAPGSNVQFYSLTVNDLNILGNVSNVIPAIVNGPIIYVANTANTLTDINNSGIITGNAANGFYAGILYQTTGQYANTWDLTVGNSVGIYSGNIYSDAGLFQNILHVGYANADPAKTYPDASVQVDCDVNSYNQIVLQNHNMGANASSDFVAVNNNGDDTMNYIDMGINSNVYNNSDYALTKPNDGYLYVNGGNLTIGTQTAGKYINFFTGGTNSTSYIRGTLNDAGLSMIGNVTANNFIGNTLAAVTVSASGNITGSYLSALNQISVQGNVIAQNVNTGILSASGNIVSDNIRTGNISATGNITASYLITANTIIDSGVSTTGTITAQAITATTISGTGNITGTTINATTRFISPLISVTGNITGGNLLTDGYISTTGNATFGNVQTTGRVTVTGNLDAGNLRTANTVFATTVSATGNISASYYFGNGSQLTGINAFQTVVANGVNLLANSTSGILTLTSGNNFIITSNATTDTVTLAVSNSPSFVGNVTAGNILASGIVSSTGNVIGGNVRTAGIVTATGNITTAGYFVGDGGFISNVTGITGTKIVNGTSYANIAAAGGNLVIAVGGNTVQTVTSTGANITGYANVTGNVTTANLAVTNKTNLNSNANVTITGGIPGQTLTTDGAGNLSWTSPTAGNVVTLVGNTSPNINFTYNTTTLIYLPTGPITINLANYTAGHTARLIIRFGTPYTVNMGVANAQQTTEGTTTLPTTGAGGHKIVGNQSIQLLYTCFDNTAANCYVASTFL